MLIDLQDKVWFGVCLEELLEVINDERIRCTLEGRYKDRV